jgi:excisionase family DNA binding protein
MITDDEMKLARARIDGWNSEGELSRLTLKEREHIAMMLVIEVRRGLRDTPDGLFKQIKILSAITDGTLGTSEVAEMLGCAGRTVQNLIHDGELPNAYRMGPRRWRIPGGDVRAYKAKHKGGR